MEAAEGRILKGRTVKLEGRFQLNAEPMERAGQDSHARQVRVVERGSGFTVLEVTCGCGARTYVRCEHEQADSGGGRGK